MDLDFWRGAIIKGLLATFVALFSIALGMVGYWSFIETTEFILPIVRATTSMVSPDFLAITMSVVFQFGGTAALSAAGYTRDVRFWKFLVGLAVALGSVDVYTNVMAIKQVQVNLPADQAAFGYGLAVFATFVEELIAYFAAFTMQLVGEALVEVGYAPPRWLFMFEQLARAAATGRRAHQQTAPAFAAAPAGGAGQQRLSRLGDN